MEIPAALSDFSFVLVYLLAAALFAMGPLIIAFLIAPKSFGATRDDGCSAVRQERRYRGRRKFFGFDTKSPDTLSRAVPSPGS